jgi:excisionase family DNA binding protein
LESAKYHVGVTEEDLVLLSDAAREVHLTTERLRQLIKSGELTAQQLGGRYWYIRRADLEAFKAKERPAAGWPKGKPRK